MNTSSRTDPPRTSSTMRHKPAFASTVTVRDSATDSDEDEDSGTRSPVRRGVRLWWCSQTCGCGCVAVAVAVAVAVVVAVAVCVAVAVWLLALCVESLRRVVWLCDYVTM